jgi:hypothetical protein
MSEDQLERQAYQKYVIREMKKKSEFFVVKLADLFQNAFSLDKIDDDSVRSQLQKRYKPVIRQGVIPILKNNLLDKQLIADKDLVSILAAIKKKYHQQYNTE